MRTYDKVASLPLRIEGYELDRLERSVSDGWTRVTTVVRLQGAGEEGLGEEVGYDADDHDALHAEPPDLDFDGVSTLDEASARLAEGELFPRPPSTPMYRPYRRWAFESAAFDLALRQAGRSVAEALGRRPRPLRFVVSCSLGEPPSLEPVARRRQHYPGLRFKLDPVGDWDAGLIAELEALDVVDVVDLKGLYVGTSVDRELDLDLYRRVVGGFADAIIEDPVYDERTQAILEPHRHRISWDAPIHSVADIEAMPFAPRVLNIKPSRFGALAALLDAYDHCERRRVQMYGGGQFELGPGRGQVQLLAALFHPDGPNDVAPAGYNLPEVPADLPEGPLDPAPAPIGFRRV